MSSNLLDNIVAGFWLRRLFGDCALQSKSFLKSFDGLLSFLKVSLSVFLLSLVHIICRNGSLAYQRLRLGVLRHSLIEQTSHLSRAKDLNPLLEQQNLITPAQGTSQRECFHVSSFGVWQSKRTARSSFACRKLPLILCEWLTCLTEVHLSRVAHIGGLTATVHALPDYCLLTAVHLTYFLSKADF